MLYTWKNLKNYYKKYLQRVVLYNCLLTDKFTAVPLRLSVDKRSKKTHLLYLALLSKRKKTHFVKFYRSRKHKKQGKSVVSIKSFSRITNANSWRIIRKLFELTQRASQILLQEHRMIRLKNDVVKLTFWNTTRTSIAKKLRSKRRYYVNTPITLNFVFKDKSYINKWFFLNLIRMVSKEPKFFDVKFYLADKSISYWTNLYTKRLDKNNAQNQSNSIILSNLGQQFSDSALEDNIAKGSGDDIWWNN